jgi:hypothetical protein
MGRTLLRGIELAGVRLAIEVPPLLGWEWPDADWASLSCSPIDPDIYVGVRVGEIDSPEWDPITYSFEGGSFDVGRIGTDWGVIVRDVHGHAERLARFDERMSEGEVIVTPQAAQGQPFPMAGPLMDIALLQRVSLDGALVASGTVVIRGGRALVFLGVEGASHHAPIDIESEWQSDGDVSQMSVTGRLVLRPNSDGVWLHVLPGSAPGSCSGATGRVDGVHVVDESHAVYAERLDPDAAIAQLLQYAWAPVHDPESADRLLAVADCIAARVPVAKLGLPGERRVIPFTWGQRHAALAFAQPIPS